MLQIGHKRACQAVVHLLLVGSLCGLAEKIQAAEPQKPFFEFRGWETQVDGLWCGLRGGSSYWYKNQFYLDYPDGVLKKAPKYGTNALILMGRHNYAEVHTFISYHNWPLLHEIHKDRRRADRELQIKRLNELVEKAKRHGVEVYLWTHELHLPAELTKKYPKMAGVGSRYCPSQPDLWRFVSSKYEELFDRVPGLAGMFLTMSETQSNLIKGSPCKCEKCKKAKPEELLEQIIRGVHRPLKARNKRLVVRTFSGSLDQIAAICGAIKRLPKDLDVTVMSKSTSCDFFGMELPVHSAFDLIENRPQFMEEVFGEFRGKTNIVCTPAEFFRKRIRYAARKGVSGIVLRIDHNGYPKSNFETPNLFNIFFTSKLWRDPQADPAKIWKTWFDQRYGAKAAELLIPAFANTQNIWERGTNTLGFYTVSAHGNLAPLYRGSYCARENMDCSIGRVTKGYPEWDRLGKQLRHPSDATLGRIEAEIAEANRLAAESLDLVRRSGKDLSEPDRKELEHYFGVLHRTAAIFGQMKKLYFLGLQAEQAKGGRRAAKMEKIVEESRRAIEIAYQIERDHGQGHWPLSPDDGRGSDFYLIMEDYLTECLTGLTLKGKIPRQGWGSRIGSRTATGKLWRRVVDIARPGRNKADRSSEFALDGPFEQLQFAGDKIELKTSEGAVIAWPVAKPVEGPTLVAGRTYHITLKNEADRVVVQAQEKARVQLQSSGAAKMSVLDRVSGDAALAGTLIHSAGRGGERRVMGERDNAVTFAVDADRFPRGIEADTVYLPFRIMTQYAFGGELRLRLFRVDDPLAEILIVAESLVSVKINLKRDNIPSQGVLKIVLHKVLLKPGRSYAVQLECEGGDKLLWVLSKTPAAPHGYYEKNRRRSEIPAGFGIAGKIVSAERTPQPETLKQSLYEYQRKQADRDQALRDTIRTEADLKAYKKKVRRDFQKVLGPWPARTPLKPRVTGTLQRDGYRIEKIVIQSRPGFYVTINLYVPIGRKTPMPAVLSPLGHASSGKAWAKGDNYQARFITLARKGYVVLAYDPLGQGEREAYGAATGNHHYIQGYQCMPSGRHFASYFIWDGIRCLDYLETRPEVDPKRIACSGCSGGGTLTNYISAVDDRVAVSVPSSWVRDSLTLSQKDTGLHTESWFPGVCDPYGPGTRQLLCCIAPRPLLIIGNQQDREFPPANMAAVYRDVKRLYEQLGIAERVEYVNVHTKHGFWPEARRELYRFVNKWFEQNGSGIDEAPVKAETEKDLHCAPGGQVRNLPDAQIVYSLNQALMEQLRADRAARRKQLSRDRYLEQIRKGILGSPNRRIV